MGSYFVYCRAEALRFNVHHGSSFGDALCVSDPTGDEALAQILPECRPHVCD